MRKTMNTVFRHKYCTTSCPNRTIQGQRSRPVLAQASVSKELLSRRGTAYTYEHSQRTPARQLSQRLKVISLVADCVQINSDVARFEMLAGRSAMVGFAVAFCSELILPHEGLFGAWGSQAQTFAATALLLTTSAAILATMSKRRLGMHFQEAVLTSLTALSRSASSITHRNVDSAVDYVFEQVFGTSFVDANLLDIDDFI